MGILIVVGGQFGSEGKGKTSYYFANKSTVSSVIRVGGTNAGHTVIGNNGNPQIFQVLPTASINQEKYCVIAPGSYIELDLLFHEIKISGISKNKLKIHPNAGIITKYHKQKEKDCGICEKISSTGSGTGAAVGSRVMRDSHFVRALDVDELKPYLCDTTSFLTDELRKGHDVLIEGTQGFGLSNIHSPYYPYVTSRDTTAPGFLSEVGLSPFDVKEIILVIRSFPIRVAGDSGPLPNELTWREVTEYSERLDFIQEYTSVTKRIRRVGKFDSDIVRQAIRTNKPSKIVLNHFDYVPTREQHLFIENVQFDIGAKIDYVGTNPKDIYKV